MGNTGSLCFPSDIKPLVTLTPKEHEYFRFFLYGASLGKTAQNMRIAVSTARAHHRAVRRKLKAKASRYHITRRAIDCNLARICISESFA